MTQLWNRKISIHIMRPLLKALTVSLGVLVTAQSFAVEEIEHSEMGHPHTEHGSIQKHTTPVQSSTSKTDTKNPESVHRSKTGHGHDDMDHSKTNHDSANAHTTTRKTPIPEITDADRKAAFPPLDGHKMHDSGFNNFFLLNKFEYQDADDGGTLYWDISGWIGGDINRLLLRSEGERTDSATEAAELQLLYGRAVNPWWELVAGIRHDFKPEESQTWFAIGIQGMALYDFETEATLFVGENGKTAARFEGEYDILLTNLLILQPKVEANFYGKNDPSHAIGSGLANTEISLRLRYEIVRQFAPYIGLTWNRSFGKTADFIREKDKNIDEMRFVAGIRIWF